MLRQSLRALATCTAVILMSAMPVVAGDPPGDRPIQEEVWAIPVTLPTIAYVVLPVGDGPFPLVVMNHGASLNQRERSFFPLVEFRETSLERVAAFLLEMDRRLTAGGVIALPMRRRDIADYLGLTLETVSRALSNLHGEGVLGFVDQTERQIVLLDRVRLAELDL